MHWQTYFIEFSYLLLRSFSSSGSRAEPSRNRKRRHSPWQSYGMMMAIIGTLMHVETVSYTWIIVGLLLARPWASHGRVGADDADAATDRTVHAFGA